MNKPKKKFFAHLKVQVNSFTQIKKKNKKLITKKINKIKIKKIMCYLNLLHK